MQAGNMAGFSFRLKKGCVRAGWAPQGRVQEGEGKRLGAKGEFRGRRGSSARREPRPWWGTQVFR